MPLLLETIRPRRGCHSDAALDRLCRRNLPKRETKNRWRPLPARRHAPAVYRNQMSPLHWLNNAAEQHPQESIAKITEKQLERTFRANIFSMFFMTKAVMRHFKNGGNIINTTSVTAYQGSPHLLDYSSTKGAIVAFTRSLCQALADKEIRVNAVAPAPIWMPLIPSTFPTRMLILPSSRLVRRTASLQNFSRPTSPASKRHLRPSASASRFVSLASRCSFK
jgi:NAD(P)-dependent dehydrogenase (short-subunit alcohol dehydrogenase family)